MFPVLWTQEIHTLLRRSIEGPPPSIQSEGKQAQKKICISDLNAKELRSLVHRSPARNPIKRYTSPYAKTIYFGSLVHASILIQKRTQRSEIFLWIFEASLVPFIRPLWVSAFLMRTLSLLLVSRILALYLQARSSFALNCCGKSM